MEKKQHERFKKNNEGTRIKQVIKVRTCQEDLSKRMAVSEKVQKEVEGSKGGTESSWCTGACQGEVWSCHLLAAEPCSFLSSNICSLLQ